MFIFLVPIETGEEGEEEQKEVQRENLKTTELHRTVVCVIFIS